MFVMQLCKGTSTLQAELLCSSKVEGVSNLGPVVARVAGDSVAAVTMIVLIVPNCLLSCMDFWPDTLALEVFTHLFGSLTTEVIPDLSTDVPLLDSTLICCLSPAPPRDHSREELSACNNTPSTSLGP